MMEWLYELMQEQRDSEIVNPDSGELKENNKLHFARHRIQKRLARDREKEREHRYITKRERLYEETF